jgi:glycerophosphoryl diester phosphodiesterase
MGKILLIFALLFSVSALAEPILIAHRGAGYFPPYDKQAQYPSNTIEAFDEALEQGFQGFEMDVRLSRDEKLVIAHDNRLSVATTCKGHVDDRDLQYLSRCRVKASTMIPELFAVHSPKRGLVPTLKSVLERFLPMDRVKTIVVDIKPASTDKLARAFQDLFLELGQGFSSLYSKVVFIARKEDVLRELRLFYAGAGFGLEEKTGIEPVLGGLREFVPEAYGLARREHDVISTNFGLTANELLKPEIKRLMRRSLEHGYRVLGWTLNHPIGFHFVRDHAPDTWMLLTDLPFDRARKFLDPSDRSDAP